MLLPQLEPEVDEPRAVQDADYLAQVGMWPPTRKVDPRRWLANFTETERPYAEDLLRSFMYFSEDLCEELLRSAIQRLGQNVLDFDGSADAVAQAWRSFVGSLILLPVQGEEPRSTDSGFSYTRLARKALGFRREQFPTARETLIQLRADAEVGRVRDVVFVDDFVGSGTQFIGTWTRTVPINGDESLSFAAIEALGVHRFFCCPLIAGWLSVERIAQRCPGVVLCPAHFLPAEYSALHPNSRVWSKERRASGPAMLESIARRARMPESGGSDDWRGYWQMGLAVALGDSVPDATLGVFRWKENGWAPLFNDAPGS